ncbi:hypothetical protein DBV15_05821 [Temnothorax longispinosus]|uniref:Uncharacterized protein n=1 Tax=Temnothorax longispinosus TaxID=300112 RepID=A0A4S2JMF5_9HYME|nr:hypothetical protein DBV15_05821 [Temnothorax longispinosus]
MRQSDKRKAADRGLREDGGGDTGWVVAVRTSHAGDSSGRVMNEHARIDSIRETEESRETEREMKMKGGKIGSASRIAPRRSSTKRRNGLGLPSRMETRRRSAGSGAPSNADSLASPPGLCVTALSMIGDDEDIVCGRRSGGRQRRRCVAYTRSGVECIVLYIRGATRYTATAWPRPFMRARARAPVRACMLHLLSAARRAARLGTLGSCHRQQRVNCHYRALAALARNGTAAIKPSPPSSPPATVASTDHRHIRHPTPDHRYYHCQQRQWGRGVGVTTATTLTTRRRYPDDAAGGRPRETRLVSRRVAAITGGSSEALALFFNGDTFLRMKVAVQAVSKCGVCTSDGRRKIKWVERGPIEADSGPIGPAAAAAFSRQGCADIGRSVGGSRATISSHLGGRSIDRARATGEGIYD